MPYPMTPRNYNSPGIEVGSETGIEQKNSPLQADEKVDKSVGKQIEKIFINLWDILKILVKWR
tara:strand:+ start:1112 stop:1300 length:189 start_codon:yes stop_codon:yes gene_type:complete